MTVDSNLEALTGLFIALSGQVFDNQKYILAMPTRSDIDNLSRIDSAKFNSIKTDVSSIQSQLTNVITYIQNLKGVHQSLYESFINHTGEYVYALSGDATSGAHSV